MRVCVCRGLLVESNGIRPTIHCAEIHSGDSQETECAVQTHSSKQKQQHGRASWTSGNCGEWVCATTTACCCGWWCCQTGSTWSRFDSNWLPLLVVVVVFPVSHSGISPAKIHTMNFIYSPGGRQSSLVYRVRLRSVSRSITLQLCTVNYRCDAVPLNNDQALLSCICRINEFNHEGGRDDYAILI